jgi:hypothetical protein
VGVTHDEAGPGGVGDREASLKAAVVTNVKCYGRFHDTTLRFPAQIIKGRPTSKYVEVYCRICGA